MNQLPVVFSFLLKSVIWEYISSVNIEFIPLARKGFWVDFLDRRFLGKCCFPVQTINARNKNKKKGFSFHIFPQREVNLWFLADPQHSWVRKKNRNYKGQRVKKKKQQKVCRAPSEEKNRKYTWQQVTPPPEIIQGENYIGWTTEIIQREKQKLYRATKFPGVITRQSKQDCLLGGSGTDAVSNPLI